MRSTETLDSILVALLLHSGAIKGRLTRRYARSGIVQLRIKRVRVCNLQSETTALNRNIETFLSHVAALLAVFVQQGVSMVHVDEPYA